MKHPAIPNHIKDECAGRTREEIEGMIAARRRVVIWMENADRLSHDELNHLSWTRWDIDHLKTYLAHYEEYAQ